MRLSNSGVFYSVTELGRVYDPIMWEVAAPARPNGPWGDVMPSSKANSEFGGGNSLRIGRPEHARFVLASDPGQEGYRLLDLFHAGRSRSTEQSEREGGLIRINGHVNLNTASRSALRALVYGEMIMDPESSKRLSDSHEASTLMAPRVRPFKLSQAQLGAQADLIADSIIRSRKVRPFASASEISEIVDSSNDPVFGNLDQLPGASRVHMTDSAREEEFARVYEASTVRSRNFRVWVIGQSLARSASTQTDPEVLSEVRKVFTVFADPGNRDPVGRIDADGINLKILHENSF